MICLLLVAILGCAHADVVGDVDCTNCEFSIGGIGYLEGPNCRQFYQCRMKPGGWIEHVLLCCPEGTRWNQEIKNCDWGHCNVGFDGCPNATYEEGQCNNWPDETDQAFFFVHPMWSRQMCPAGTVYKHEICNCDHGYGYQCYQDPLLHFPFAYDFNDIQCPKAAGTGYGDAEIDEEDGYLSLDGDGDYMTFAYLNNWFKDNSPKHFLISVWFRQDEGAFVAGDLEGLVSNGNCDQEASIYLHLGNQTACGGIERYLHQGGGITTNIESSEFECDGNPARFYGPANAWCNVVLRFNKETHMLDFFLNGHKVDMKEIDGVFKGTMSDFSVGLAYSDCIPNFFTGDIDDLMIFTRYVSDLEIFACIFGNGRTPGHSEKMYECPEHQP